MHKEQRRYDMMKSSEYLDFAAETGYKRDYRVESQCTCGLGITRVNISPRTSRICCTISGGFVASTEVPF